MSPLVVTLLRFGFLALIWLLVIFMLVTIRNDIFGIKVRDRNRGQTPKRAPLNDQPATQPRHLVVVRGPLTGTAIPLGTSAITVGRSPDLALVLDDGYASSRHARFYLQGETWYIEDLNSTNGTWVGTQKIQSPVELSIGVPVIIGKTTMELR
ncbi:FHA domain-containing protein FhaB/FipA [Arcanobacterium pinnipediorum]|uniref:FHA domain-containing protein n=1 Tax=Arcanobacterium pinnipediorum TaxID=1503041 RepID=A0ABY5AJQ7_9ACTO|nr:FHA domain-containing protein [Arcanobacterium pinnipediorum]USR79484.1 FHA domain-containing protein [Arcanobacterium pinnipediorum]